MTETTVIVETLAGHPVRYVSDQAGLDRAAAALADASRIAVDTEFERSNTYHAIPGLLQFFDGKTIELVDPTAGLDLRPLLAVISAPTPTKIIHSASEDIELLRRLSGHLPSSLFDTQIAAGLAGLGPAVSYRDLVSRVCDIELEKGETRSDWLRRPLSRSQLHYAGLDVAYLLEVDQWLVQKLERASRLEWVLEDSERMAAVAAEGADLGRMFREFKHAWKLDDDARKALRELLHWREAHAARRDLPRRRVLDDDAVLALAQERPSTPEAVTQIARIGRRKSRDLSSELLSVLEQAASEPAPPRPPAPLDRDGRKRLKALKQLVDEAADALAIDATLLASRRDLLALLNTGALPPKLEGWRRAVIGDELLAALA